MICTRSLALLLLFVAATACGRMDVIPGTTATPQASASVATPIPTQTAVPSAPTLVPPTPTVPPTTPTPVPIDTPRDAIVAQLLPAGPVTLPPTDWMPVRPEGFDAAQDTPASWVHDYLFLVTDMLNAIGDVDAVLDQLVAWMPADSAFEGPRPPNAWSVARDLDGDGTEEWLISVPSQDRGCWVTYCPGYVMLYQVRDGLFTPLSLILFSAETWDISRPMLLMVDDINADGLTEVVLEGYECGANTCFTSLLVGRWDGQHWRDLAADPIQQAYTAYTIEDYDNDGIQEIVMHGGIFGSMGAGLQRPHTLVFDWRDGAYRLAEDIPDPDDHPYYRILDANTALARGQWDTALALALDVVNAPGIYTDDWTPADAWARIVGYAAIEALLVHAHRGDGNAMTDVYGQLLARNYAMPNNPYPAAAERLLNIYRQTGDVLAACQAMEAVLVEHAGAAEFFDWYGYGTERLPQTQLCPLDTGD